MSGLRLVFVPVDQYGNVLTDVRIGVIDDAPGVPGQHEVVMLGGTERWEVVEVACDFLSTPQQANVKVRRITG